MSKTPRIRADGEETRRRILESAGALIAENGFAETSNKSVAAQAEVDLASINHHFGNRSGLYQQVLVEAHRRIIRLDELQALVASPVAPQEKLRVFIDRLVALAQAERGWHTRVLAREILSPSSHLQVLISEELQPKLALLLGILSEVTGIPPTDPALLRCLISVAAPSLMLIVASNGLPGPAQQVLAMPQAVLSNHLYSFALAGLEAIGREHNA